MEGVTEGGREGGRLFSSKWRGSTCKNKKYIHSPWPFDIVTLWPFQRYRRSFWTKFDGCGIFVEE